MFRMMVGICLAGVGASQCSLDVVGSWDHQLPLVCVGFLNWGACKVRRFLYWIAFSQLLFGSPRVVSLFLKREVVLLNIFFRRLRNHSAMTGLSRSMCFWQVLSLIHI